MSIASHTTSVPSGATVHYLSAGESTSPVLLLLHGFPTSSVQYKTLIPLFSEKYRVLAPDLPGFGKTTVPSTFKYTFANIASVIGEWLDAVNVKRFAVYIFDYGAPTAFRLALARPKAIAAIISQNGNAYTEGLGPFWAPLQQWWGTADASAPIRDVIKDAALTVDATKAQYVDGESADRVARISEKKWISDYEENIRDKKDIQLDLFFDYRTNVDLYPEFQSWLRDSQVPVLAIWGKNDPIFISPGAEAYTRDVKSAKVVLVDGGHFLLETHVDEVAAEIAPFLDGVKF